VPRNCHTAVGGLDDRRKRDHSGPGYRMGLGCGGPVMDHDEPAFWHSAK